MGGNHAALGGGDQATKQFPGSEGHGFQHISSRFSLSNPYRLANLKDFCRGEWNPRRTGVSHCAPRHCRQCSQLSLFGWAEGPPVAPFACLPHVFIQTPDPYLRRSRRPTWPTFPRPIASFSSLLSLLCPIRGYLCCLQCSFATNSPPRQIIFDTHPPPATTSSYIVCSEPILLTIYTPWTITFCAQNAQFEIWLAHSATVLAHCALTFADETNRQRQLGYCPIRQHEREHAAANAPPNKRRPLGESLTVNPTTRTSTARGS